MGEAMGMMIPASMRSVTAAVEPDGVMAAEISTLGSMTTRRGAGNYPASASRSAR
jgi:hypothetical protein